MFFFNQLKKLLNIKIVGGGNLSGKNCFSQSYYWNSKNQNYISTTFGFDFFLICLFVPSSMYIETSL